MRKSGDEKAASILGWVSLGTGVASLVLSVGSLVTKGVEKIGQSVGKWQARLQQAGGKPSKLPGGINNTPVSAAEVVANTKPPKGAAILKNSKAALYDSEEKAAGLAVINGDAQISIITDARSLEVLNNKNQVHKFILNEEGILAVGSISKKVNPKSLSHPVLAGGNDTPGVISAGYLHRNGRTVYVVNHSGHYLPEYNRLKPVAKMLANSFNLKVKKVKAGSLYHRLYVQVFV